MPAADATIGPQRSVLMRVAKRQPGMSFWSKVPGLKNRGARVGRMEFSVHLGCDFNRLRMEV
jgi:hypothetical protein